MPTHKMYWMPGDKELTIPERSCLTVDSRNPPQNWPEYLPRLEALWEELVVLHQETFGQEELLDSLQNLQGVQIQDVDNPMSAVAALLATDQANLLLGKIRFPETQSLSKEEMTEVLSYRQNLDLHSLMEVLSNQL